MTRSHWAKLQFHIFVLFSISNHCGGQICTTLIDGVIYYGSSIDVSDSTPGQFVYSNMNSPDYEVTYIVEYSNTPSFSNLPSILSDRLSSYEFRNGGAMGDVDLQIVDGMLAAGRFVFVKALSPDQKFYFPVKVGALQNGQTYWIRNYRVSNGCRSSAAIAETSASPPLLQALGVPSAPRNLTMNFSCPQNDPFCSFQFAWAPPADTGIGANSSQPLPLNYSLRIVKPTLPSSMTDPTPAVCPDLPSSVTAAVVGQGQDDLQKPQTKLAGADRGWIYCIYARARNNRLGLLSSAAVMLARPVGPPSAPARVSLQLNPTNSSNTSSGAVDGLVVWQAPDDRGAGLGVLVDIAEYSVSLSGCDGANQLSAAAPADASGGGSLQYAFHFGCNYSIAVAGRNQQGPSLGVFSAWGAFQTIYVFVSQPPALTVNYVRPSDGHPVSAAASDGSPLSVSIFVGAPVVLTFQAEMSDVPSWTAGAGLALGWVDLDPPLPPGTLVVSVDPPPAAAQGQPLRASATVQLSATAAMLRLADVRNQFLGCIEAVGAASAAAKNLRARLCLQVEVIRPKPRITGLTDSLQATVGCTLRLLVNASDPTELEAELEQVRGRGYLVSVGSNGTEVASTYRTFSYPALPEGAVLGRPTDPSLCPIPPNRTAPSCLPVENWVTYQLSWQPRRQQEGFAYRLCFEAVPQILGVALRGVGGPQRISCVRVVVQRCRFCSQAGDSLETVAKLWRVGSWLSLWSGNHLLNNTDGIPVGAEIQVGPVLRVGGPGMVTNGEDLPHLARRYNVGVKDLLWWNPDLADEGGVSAGYMLGEDQEVCLVPDACVAPGFVSAAGF